MNFKAFMEDFGEVCSTVRSSVASPLTLVARRMGIDVSYQHMAEIKAIRASFTWLTKY
jgi:hypothetical protein